MGIFDELCRRHQERCEIIDKIQDLLPPVPALGDSVKDHKAEVGELVVAHHRACFLVELDMQRALFVLRQLVGEPELKELFEAAATTVRPKPWIAAWIQRLKEQTEKKQNEVPGQLSLLDEPGVLEEVAALAAK